MSIGQVGSEGYTSSFSSIERTDVKRIFSENIRLPSVDPESLQQKIEEKKVENTLLCDIAGNIPANLHAISKGFLRGLLKASEESVREWAREKGAGILGDRMIMDLGKQQS